MNMYKSENRCDQDDHNLIPNITAPRNSSVATRDQECHYLRQLLLINAMEKGKTRRENI